ncbi:MAG: RsmB/NOP family class I SAM-dependent RNA methyltransferase [Gemmobacter sp.]
MTPSARLSAAIAVLDRWLGGTPAEQALTNWGRASRYAGSGDRHAVRDLVFDAIRCRRSFAHLGGGETGRGLILGGLRAAGQDPAALFTGEGHSPAPLGSVETARPDAPQGLVALDCPDWIAPLLQSSLGSDFAPIMQALRHRAPVFLRVNTARLTREDAVARLAAEGVAACPHPLAPTALQVTDGARKIGATTAYATGLVEVQDAASQAVVAALPLAPGLRVLDLCAGGGGKALAMAAAGARVTAHDASPARMRDLPARASRAGQPISTTLRPEATAPWDLVLADAPCSGSGAWRRAPEGKWALTPARLRELCAMQAAILDRSAGLVRPGGWLGYATCSMLEAENDDQAAAFLSRHPVFGQAWRLRLTPLDGGDGFFLALFTRSE